MNSSGIDVTLAEDWDGSDWHIQRTPNPAGAQSFSALTGVSCLTRDVCEASGLSDAGPFAERLNGTDWSLQSVPAPTGAQFALLFNVSCAGSSCEAVGGYVDSSGAFVTLGERWNGAAWSPQSTHNPAQASTNYLGGVSCASSSDCTAVGQGNGDGTPTALGERWRGGDWRLQDVPSPIGAAENQLNGIACPSTHRCLSVGTVGPTLGVVSAEALGWNGRTWELQHIPALPGAALNAVACASATYCVAVGASSAGTLAERWNGERWAIQATPNPPGAQTPAFNAVSCPSASSCMAVGSYSDGMGGQLILTERWDGHTWTLVPAPTPSTQPQNGFNGVACPAALACIAVGTSFDASGNPTGTFAERWNGTGWNLQPTPTQDTPGGFLASVWCKSVEVCIATGSTNAGTLAERLTGTSWSVLPTPNQPDTQSDFIASLSCTSLSACTGVGAAFAKSGAPQTLAERWDGVQWRIQPTPLLPGVRDLSNFSVACPAHSICIAAGGFENDGPGAKTLTEQWQDNGTTTAQTAARASSSRAYHSIVGCIHSAMTERLAGRALARRGGPKITAPMPRGAQHASQIERITSVCAAR